MEQDNKRDSIYPIKYHDIWERYKIDEAQFWTSSIADFSGDDFNGSLDESQKRYLKMLLFFFANSDSVVADNIALNFLSKDDLPAEAAFYYGFQIMMENIHNECYALLIQNYIEDPIERDKAFKSIENFPVVAKKMEWAKKWISEGTYEEKLIAFVAVEHILFSSTFAGIFGFKELKKPLNALYVYNAEISRDECYVPETEVLTPKGWKNITTIKEDDIVYGYDEGKIKAEPVLRTINKHHKGKLVTIENQSHKCKVTENHDMLRYSLTKNTWFKTKAIDSLTSSKTCFPQFGNLVGETNDKYELSPLHKFLIAVQADGYKRHWENAKGEKMERGKDGGSDIGFTLTKQRKINALVKILSDLGLEYTTSPSGVKTVFYIKSNGILDSYDLKSLSWIYDEELTHDFCSRIIDEVVKWDGHKYNETRVLYCSTNKPNIDIIQGIASLCGKETHIITTIDKRKETYLPYYRLSIKDGRFKNSMSYNKTVEEYDGMVHCLTVPSGNLITRLDGKTMVSGNCGHGDFGILMYTKYTPNQLPKERVRQIILEACEVERVFVDDSFGDGVVGFSKDKMLEYVNFVTDNTLIKLGQEPEYGVMKNPLKYMENIALSSRENFFENRTVEYSKLDGGAVEIDEDDF